MSADSGSKIPVIDIGNLYHRTEVCLTDPEIEKISNEFGNALHECGFAYLVNHGIPDTLIKSAFQESECFFDLPADVKLKCAKGDINKNYHGYSPLGQENFSAGAIRELKESYDLFGNNRFYPGKEVPLFEESLESLETACRSLDTKLLKLLAFSLKLEDNLFFNNACKSLEDLTIPGLNVFRTLFYPPIPNEVREGDIRCGEHTDYGVISLLFQDHAGGLQVKDAQNQWINVEYVPNSIVVNTGDLLDAWTGGYFPATPHRVVVPESEIKRRQGRQSMAYFLHPDNHVLVSRLKLGIDWESTAADFEPILAFDHAMNKAKQAYGTY